jgi:hypothetical protein
MVDWLRPHFAEENKIGDLFYAIADCQGWIKSTKTEVMVRLEALQQSRRRQAQEMLYRKLTSPSARTPAWKAKLHVHKWLSVEVCEEPTTDVQKNDVFGILPERSDVIILPSTTVITASEWM